MTLLVRVLLAVLRSLIVGGLVLFPSWWAAGRIPSRRTSPFFRLLLAAGLGLFDYILLVNLVGKLFSNSFAGVGACLLLNASAGAYVLRGRPREEYASDGLAGDWRRWLVPVLLAFAVGFPQWFLAVSTNYWDEDVASAIHISAPNQFAEGVFPPRHNALPDVTIKYHYAFVILSGTTERLLGIPANNAIDVVSTGLWLFVFLFVFFWFRELEFDALESGWASFALLLGGALAWLYLPRIEAYNGVEKFPGPKDLLHRYEPAKSWLTNLIQLSGVPSQHLRNGDGSLSNLPWDVSSQFQQHAVSLGIAMALVALYLFAAWRNRKEGRGVLLAANVAAFGTLFLCHAVFGMVGAIAAGTLLLVDWWSIGTWDRFGDGAAFAAGAGVLALLNGGMLARGAQYGGGGFMTLRRGFGYSLGGLAGFVNWNLASFGVLLPLAALAAVLKRRRARGDEERETLFWALAIIAVFSYLMPQLVFYSSETSGVEQFTEITKFCFSAHFALALLSAWGIAALRGMRRRRELVAACVLACAVSPLAYIYANSFDGNGKWLGFYLAPYHPNSIEEHMATELRRMKKSPRDVYFDASADERRSNYLNEMFYYGGSVFETTPSSYERTGVGFRIAQDVVARRYVQNGRIARLLPGAAEAASCTWYYCRPLNDSIVQPVIVRSRFAKLVAEGGLALKAAAGLRALYSFDKPTADLDRDIERYWSPKVVAQTVADCDGSGRNALIFYDYVEQKILCGKTVIALPERERGEFVNLYVARFPGEPKSDFLVGRLQDTDFRLGKNIDQNVEYDGWAWSYRAARDRDWEPEYVRWFWDSDVPLVADLNHSGFATHFAYRPKSGEWIAAPDRPLAGPKVDEKLIPIPFAGRFQEGSTGDLGIWSLMDGMVTLKSLNTGKTSSFRWGGTYGFILVPGDYDGIGRDEMALFNQNDLSWYWTRAPGSPISFGKFGTKTGVPVPWDYRREGHLDLAYWEPAEGKIYVSFDRGRSVGQVIKVPPHCIPAFVNMY